MAEMSFQLYSARNAMPWSAVIAYLAELGVRNVEGFGGVYADAPAFRALMDAHGVAMPSGHVFPLPSDHGGLTAALDLARILGMQRLFCPAPEDRFRDGAEAADWIGLARRIEDTAKAVQDAGFGFGWHNHDWEFRPLATGAVPMALLLEHAPSIEWEIDVAWVVRGGADPRAWIADHGARITAAHVKDIAPEGANREEEGWADLGDGTLDWPGLMGALHAGGTALFVLEHDCPSDLARYANRSVPALRELLGNLGKTSA